MGFEPQELRERFQAECHARWEAVEIFKAHELAAMMDERARDIIRSLRLFAPVPNRLSIARQFVKKHSPKPSPTDRPSKETSARSISAL